MLRQSAVRFGRYRLDPTQGLTRDRQVIHLTPKSLAVLCALVERSGDVVTKDELFHLVWTGIAVTDAALTTCIVELRRALEDDARRPSYIETLHRRGFRFLMSAEPERLTAPPHVPAASGAPIVGRASALQQMSSAFARARAGTRQVVFVTGEAGIGKTSLVRTFLSSLPGDEPWRVARADCVEHYGAGEAFQPLLEALTRLCLQPEGARVVTTLRRCAPTWLAQLPAVQTPAELAMLRRRAAGVTPERMLRELTDALEALAIDAPLVLVLEDLHWSDVSTLDWIASFAHRLDPARLFLIGTSRPGDASHAGRSPLTIAQGLALKGLALEIALPGLDREAVAEYVTRAFPAMPDAHDALDRLAGLLSAHTDGNPLFLVTVLADLVARGLIVACGDRWEVREHVDVASLGIPVDIRRTIERQIDRLSADECRALEVASVLGATCSAGAIAAGVEASVSDVEQLLDALARRHAFIRPHGAAEWPDGTVSASFAFQHALYADVLSGRLSPARRAEVHRRIAMRLEAAYGDRAPEIAAELAVHFDQARDLPRAVVYLQHAAETDCRRSAHEGARQHFRRALALIDRLPASAERDDREAALRIGLGSVLMQIDGWGTPAVEESYTRARDLCEHGAATPRLFSSLWNLWIFYAARGRFDAAQALVDRLFALARESADDEMMLQAHHAQWSTLFMLGDLRGAEAHASEGLTYAERESGGRAFMFGSHDPIICARAFRARSLALLGQTDTAARLCEDAVRRARELDHPFTLAFMLVHAAAVHQTRRDAVAVRDHAVAAHAIAGEQCFGLMDAWASSFLGWSLAELGHEREGLSWLETGLARARATGATNFEPHLLGLLASAQIGAGRYAEARRSLDDGIALSDRTRERFFAAELYRLRGELRLSTPETGAADVNVLAERDLQTAWSIANDQQARQLALRTAVSLARLWGRTGRGQDAARLLRDARASIVEGADLPDVVEAAALIST